MDILDNVDLSVPASVRQWRFDSLVYMNTRPEEVFKAPLKSTEDTVPNLTLTALIGWLVTLLRPHR